MQWELRRNLAKIQINSPKSRPFLLINPISCFPNTFLATAVHTTHSYFIHRKFCLRLSKRIVAYKGCYSATKFSASPVHSQFCSKIIFSPSQDRRNYASTIFKQVFRLTQVCHFVRSKHGTLGKTTGLQHKVFVFLKYQHFNTQP